MWTCSHETKSLPFPIPVSTKLVSINNSAGALRSFTGHIYILINGSIPRPQLGLTYCPHLCALFHRPFFMVIMLVCLCLHVWPPSLLISILTQNVNGSVCSMTRGKNHANKLFSWCNNLQVQLQYYSTALHSKQFHVFSATIMKISHTVSSTENLLNGLK